MIDIKNTKDFIKDRGAKQMNNSTKLICPVFNNKFPKLSLEALGVLGQMINLPEMDYCNFSKLCEMNPADSPAVIKAAVEELLNEGCIIKINGKILAVDKHVVTKMKVV